MTRKPRASSLLRSRFPATYTNLRGVHTLAVGARGIVLLTAVEKLTDPSVARARLIKKKIKRRLKKAAVPRALCSRKEKEEKKKRV